MINLYMTQISLAAITIIVLLILYIWQTNKNNTFDLIDVLLGPDGKVSLYKIGQAVALVVSTWAFVSLVQNDKLTEYYFFGYMTVWSGINLAKNIFVKAPEDASSNKT